MSRKSRGGSNKDKSGGLPPSFPQESNPEHRAFLIRSLERNDVDLTALAELNRSLGRAKDYILSTCGELVLLDLGQGRLTVINDELHDSKKGTISTDVGGNEDPSSSYSLTPKQKELCIDFLLRMKLRRKLLNRLSRRLNRVAHAMDGEDVKPPAPPKYGDLRLHIDPTAVQAYVDRWDKQDKAKQLLFQEKERRRIQEVKFWQEQEEILRQEEERTKEEERRKIQEENLAKQDAQQENEEVEGKAETKQLGCEKVETMELEDEKAETKQLGDEKAKPEELTDQKAETKDLGNEKAETKELEQEKDETKETGEAKDELLDSSIDKSQDEQPNMASPDKVASLAKTKKPLTLSSPPPEDPVSSVLSDDLRAVLNEFDSCYERKWDPTKPSTGHKVQYTILDTPMEEDHNVIKYGAGIGAINSSMSAREREAEYKRWQTALLNRIPDQPTFEDLGLKDRVFCLEGRRKRALEDVEESPSKKNKSIEDTENDTNGGEQKNEEDPVKKKLDEELTKVDTTQDNNETAVVQSQQPETIKSNTENVKTIKEEEDGNRTDKDAAMKDNVAIDGDSQSNGQADKVADKTADVQLEQNKEMETVAETETERSPAILETKENAMDADSEDVAMNGSNDHSGKHEGLDADQTHLSEADNKKEESVPKEGVEVEDNDNNNKTEGKTETQGKAESIVAEAQAENNDGSSNGDQSKLVEVPPVGQQDGDPSEINKGTSAEGEDKDAIADSSEKLANSSGHESASTQEKNNLSAGEANEVDKTDNKGEVNDLESPSTKEENSSTDSEKAMTSDTVDDIEMVTSAEEGAKKQSAGSAADNDDAVNSSTQVETADEVQGEKAVKMDVDSEEPQANNISNDDAAANERQADETSKDVTREGENQVEISTNDDMADGDNSNEETAMDATVGDAGDNDGDKAEKCNDQDETDKIEVKPQDTATDDDSDMFAADSEPERKEDRGDDKASSLGDGDGSENKDSEAPVSATEEANAAEQPDSNPEQSKIKIEPRKEFLNDDATGEKDGSDDTAKEAEDAPKIKIQPRKEFLKDKDGANKENDKQKVEETKEEPKRIKPISVAPVPSFHEQDLKRIKLIHGDLLATSIHEQARRRLSEVTLEYNKAFRLSNETYERRQAIQQQLTNLRYEHRTTLSKMKNDYQLQVAIAKKRWEKKKREHERKQAMRAMPSKWGQQPIGTNTTQRYVAFGGLPNVLGTLIGDIVDVTCLKIEKKLPKSKFEDFVPPAAPDMNKVVNAQTGETFKQQAQRRESEFQREVNALNVRLQNSEDERKRAWKKMLKTKAEFDVPHIHQTSGQRRGQIKVNLNNYHMVPLPALRNSAQQMVPRELTAARASVASYTPPRSSPGESQSKYSAARVRERISADGTVAPVTEPKKTKEGLYIRPAGRTRKGMQWNALRGIWEKISNN